MIIIPPSDIEKLGWKEGQDLEGQVRGRTLIVRLQAKRQERPKKMSYTEFKDKIKELLETKSDGLTWTTIRDTLDLPQKVPNNLWVRTMERDIGLTRKLDHKLAKVVWKLPKSKPKQSPK